MNPSSVLKNLSGLVNKGYSVVMIVNGGMLSNVKPSSEQPANHVVTFIGNFTENGDNVSFDVQSWGEVHSLTMTKEEFRNTYSGSTYGKMNNGNE